VPILEDPRTVFSSTLKTGTRKTQKGEIVSTSTLRKPIQVAEISLTEGEIEAAVNVLRSGALRQGKQCDAFEEEFAAYVGAKHAVTCANGSAALHLAYMAFLRPGDEVLVPAFTFIATGSMVTAAGGRPVFCDIDPETFLIDLADAERRITPRTKAISPVHLFGNPCAIDAVQAFAAHHNLRIVWDAAQAHGARYRGRDVGSFGDFVAYSFYPSKNMFVGEGGMTCTDNQEFEHRMRHMRSHGQTGKYLHTMFGLNYRMTDVEAAIGRKQLERLESMLAARRRNAELLNEGLKAVPGIQPQRITPGGDHAWHQYCIRVDESTFGMDRDALAAKLHEEGIATGVHYPRGLNRQPIFQELYGDEPLPITDRLATQILALPVHHGLENGDITHIVDSVITAKR
jgi:perosamine synthetase